MKLIDAVRKLSPVCSPVYLQGLEAAAGDFDKYGVAATPLRMSHFIGQFFGETGGGKVLQESGAYSAKRLMEIFGVGRHSAAITQAEAQRLGSMPMPAREKAIFERVYASGNPHKMKELGNRPGDGWPMRGTGPIQSTGRGSGTKWAAKLGLTMKDDQLWMLDPKIVFLPSLFEWDRGKLNALADLDDVRRIRKIINGGYNGIADVEAWQDKAWALLRDPKQPAQSWAAAAINTDTVKLQQALNQIGYSPALDADGKYGPATKKAVAWFQQLAGIKVDGIAGPVTLTVLYLRLSTTRGVDALAEAA